MKTHRTDTEQMQKNGRGMHTKYWSKFLKGRSSLKDQDIERREYKENIKKLDVV